MRYGTIALLIVTAALFAELLFAQGKRQREECSLE
jgi:hypothetical protein